MGCVDVIGHITDASAGCFLVTPDGGEIRLRAQGFPEAEAPAAAPERGAEAPAEAPECEDTPERPAAEPKCEDAPEA